MPSPFPGMNPYLEQEIIWHDFHERFLPALAALLVARIRPKYFVLIDENVYLHDLPPEPARLGGRPDLSVSRGTASVSRSVSAGVLEAPARVVLPVQDVESESFLTIRDRRNREIVTVIEILSPTNKRGDHRGQYLAKRASLLKSPVHLVEIDLLRGGTPLPPEERPDCTYSVLVSRAEERPDADFWPFRLRDPLPVIPVPLRFEDADASLDLGP